MESKNKYKFSPIFNSFIALVVVIVFCSGRLTGQTGYIENMPTEIAPVNAPFDMPEFERPQIPNRIFDIREFEAVKMEQRNSKKCTEAINKAIEAAHEAGGGRVNIPEGNWLCGPIHLKSNINLH